MVLKELGVEEAATEGGPGKDPAAMENGSKQEGEGNPYDPPHGGGWGTPDEEAQYSTPGGLFSTSKMQPPFPVLLKVFNELPPGGSDFGEKVEEIFCHLGCGAGACDDRDVRWV